MKTRKNKFFCGVLSVICSALLMSLCVSASQDTVYNWYCKRTSDHRQPIADARLQWIEQYDGYYVDHSHGDDSSDKVVYLTFDAGYENGNIEKILNTLKEEQVSGAFFILGHLISANPELVKRMADEGHTVCNHTTNHKNMTSMDTIEEFRQETEALEQLYKETIGQEMAHYYRPPEGKFDERSLGFAKELGYKTIFWSFAYADWDNGKQPDLEAAKEKILSNMHNGAVILLHPTSATNAAILGDVIRELKAQGYRFGILDELTTPMS